MYIRGTRVRVPVDQVDALITHFAERTAPQARAVPGNRGSVLLIDRSAGVGWGLTYWEDESSMAASEEAGTALRGSVVETVGATIEEVDRLELVVQERAAPPHAGTFVRLNDIQGDPERIEDSVRLTTEKIVPVIRDQKGFVAFVTGVNRKTGRGITTTVWDTLDDLHASEAAAAPLREQVVGATGAGGVKVEVFETAFADVTTPVTHG